LLLAKDGKLVEVNDPNSTSHERSLSPGLSDSQEVQVVHRKLEGFASQYYTLLKSQLEQQRIYYESRLEEIRREYGPRGQHARKKSASPSADLILALKQERNQLMQRCNTLRQRYKKVSDDVSFLKNMNESLEANKEPTKRQIMESQRQRAEARDMLQKCLPPLEEKVTKLMLQLEESMNAADVEHAPDDGEKKPAAKKK
jgi:BRCA1-associated protein